MGIILSIFFILSLICPTVSSEESELTATIILAVDVSKSMSNKLDDVKTALEEFIEKLSTDTGFRIVIIEFGTFADVVEDRTVTTEADKDDLKSAIKDDLNVYQEDTNFDEAFDEIDLEIRRLGSELGFILMYSDGISDPTPESKKSKVSPEELASEKFPAGRFNVYLIELNPEAVPMPKDIPDKTGQADGSWSTISISPSDLRTLTNWIRADIGKRYDEWLSNVPKSQDGKELQPQKSILTILKSYWRPALLLLGLIALCLIVYVIYWAFIAEGPKAKILPPEEQSKITGKASLNLGYFRGDIYNGSGWNVTRLRFRVVAKAKNGSIRWDRELDKAITISPLTAEYVSIVDVPVGRDIASFVWHIDTAWGYKSGEQ